MSKKNQTGKKNFKKEFLILLITIVVLIITASFISYHPDDYLAISSNNVPLHNWMGSVGAIISNAFFQTFGKATYLLIFIFLAIPPFILFANKELKKRALKISLGIFIFLWGTAILMTLIINKVGVQGGGFLGSFFGKIFYKYTGLIGAYSFSGLIVLYGLSKILGFFTLKELANKLANNVHKVSKYDINKIKNIKFGSFVTKKEVYEEIPALIEIKNELPSEKVKANKNKSNFENEIQQDSKEKNKIKLPENSDNQNENYNLDENDNNEENLDDSIEALKNEFEYLKNKLSTSPTNEKEIPKLNNGIEFYEENGTGENYGEDADSVEEVEISENDVDFNQPETEGTKEQASNKIQTPVKNNEKEEKPEKKINPFKKYKKPPMDILFYSEDTNLEDAREELEDTAQKIVDTLKEFKIELTKLNACYRGPVITRYEFETAPGIRMEKIERYSNNIAYSLAARKVRIIAPIPGKQAIGVEVPNKTRNNVLIGDILNTKHYDKTKAILPIALGKDISGKPIIADLSGMPHLLIAGTTGSGKSVCINSILCSFLYNKRPEDLRLILIDPKRVEMKSYNDIPHLLAPVITDPKEASMALNWAVDEMERRYELLEETGSKDIKSYNEKIEENTENNLADYDRLHYIVIIIDELADLMLIARKEIENVVARLAAKARAAGIHLIFATQSPRADIITGIIKANFQPRIAFAVATKMESRIILDTSGADKLLGKGDMLFYQPGFIEEGIAIRLQGAFVSEKEVNSLTKYLKSTCEPDYIEDIFEEEENEYGLETISASDEPIYHEAVKIVIDENRASASYLQRRLSIGYNRAARMIEYMEKEGIVGKPQGSKPREVLITSYPY